MGWWKSRRWSISFIKYSNSRTDYYIQDVGHGVHIYYEGINDEPEEVTQALHNHDNDEYTQALQRQKKRYERMAVGSLYPENIEKYQNKANELQSRIESSKIELSDEEQYAINQYIGSESYKINEVLREKLKLTEQQKMLIDNLDKALDKFQKYKGNVTRSIILDENTLKGFLSTHQEGKKVKYSAYTSATAGVRYNDESNIELHILSKTGRDIRKFNKEEQEIVFKRNTEFQIVQIKKIMDIYHIIMEEIVDG